MNYKIKSPFSSHLLSFFLSHSHQLCFNGGLNQQSQIYIIHLSEDFVDSTDGIYVKTGF